MMPSPRANASTSPSELGAQIWILSPATYLWLLVWPAPSIFSTTKAVAGSSLLILLPNCSTLLTSALLRVRSIALSGRRSLPLQLKQAVGLNEPIIRGLHA